MTASSLPASVSYTGKLVKRQLGRGSNKEKLVNALLTEEGMDIVIRHNNTTAYLDPQFDALEGKQVSLTGTMQSYVLVVDNCTETLVKKES